MQITSSDYGHIDPKAVIAYCVVTLALCSGSAAAGYSYLHKTGSQPDFEAHVHGVIVSTSLLWVLGVSLAAPAPFTFWISLGLLSLGLGCLLGLVLAMQQVEPDAVRKAENAVGAATRKTAKRVDALNLGKLADTITKLLAGATLINLREIIDWLWSAFNTAGGKLFPNQAGMPALMAVYAGAFAVMGTLIGLFVVRRYLRDLFDPE